jgi:Transposase DDE domain
MKPSIEEIIEHILLQFPELNKPAKRFFLEITLTFLGCKGKLNFRNLSRWSNLSERTIRRWFASTIFCFTSINQKLIAQYVKPKHCVIAIDASFIPKSGKHTFGLAKFWNGKHSKAEQGLEISTIALIDTDRKHAFALDTKQSVDTEDETRIDTALTQLKAQLPFTKTYTKTIVADGYYAKKKLIEGVCAEKCRLISLLRSDANLRYRYTGQQKPKQKPKQYDGKVRWKDENKQSVVPSGFVLEATVESFDLYSCECYMLQWQCWVKVVYVRRGSCYRLLFSTDLDQDTLSIYNDYSHRFQIEYLFRDGKQHLGLSDCQSLKEERLCFHFNMVMTTLNIAKISVLSSLKDRFSLQDIRSLFFNYRWLDTLFANLALDPNLMKQHQNYPALLQRGIINP